MLDVLFAFLAGVGAVLLYDHFWPRRANGAPEIPTTLEGFGQILTHGEQALVKRLDALEANIHPDQLLERMKTAMSQLFNDAFTAFQNAAAAHEAKAVADAVAAKAAELQPQIDAAREAGAAAAEAENVAAVNAAAAALQPPTA